MSEFCTENWIIANSKVDLSSELYTQLQKARREISERSKPKKIESLRKFYVKDCPDCVGTGINPNGFFHSACPYCSGRGYIPL